MKKLIFTAALAATSLFGAEELIPPAPAPEVPKIVPLNTAKTAAKQPRSTEDMRERIARQRAMFEKHMAAQRERNEAKMLSIVKKYGLDDEKSRALVKELLDTMAPNRFRGQGRPGENRPGGGVRPPFNPAVQPKPFNPAVQPTPVPPSPAMTAAPAK